MSSSKKAHAWVNDIGGNSVLGRPSLLVSGVCTELRVRRRTKLCATKNIHTVIGYYDKNEELPSLSDLRTAFGKRFFFFIENTNKYTEVLVVIVFFFFSLEILHSWNKIKRYINTPQMSQQRTTKYTGYKTEREREINANIS